MKKKNIIWKEAGVFLIAAIVVLSTAAATAITNEKQPKKMTNQEKTYTSTNTPRGDVLLYEEFFDCWPWPPTGWTTADLDNWQCSFSNYAGGWVNELKFEPEPLYYTYTYRFISPSIDTTGYGGVEIEFKQYSYNISSDDYWLHVETSSDGVTWDSVWKCDKTIPSTTTIIPTYKNVGGPEFYIAFTVKTEGPIAQILYWYIDDVEVRGYSEIVGTFCRTSGPRIGSNQVRAWLDMWIPTSKSHSTIIALTECFGGDAAGSFISRPETAVLSATSRWQLASYTGYDDDAAEALKPGPGRTSLTVHGAGLAGKSPSEKPMYIGPVVSLEDTSANGDIKSRHVLVYAGCPDNRWHRDFYQRDTIVNNFAGKYQTTVTTVGGFGTSGWDYPGTLKGLGDALHDIGQNMNEDEQFILFVTDHGGVQGIRDLIIYLTYTYTELEIPYEALEELVELEDPDPYFSITTHEPEQIPIDQIVINGYEYVEYTKYEIDEDGDDIIDFYQDVYPIDPECLEVTNQIEIYTSLNETANATCNIGTGPIPKKVNHPEAPDIDGPTNGKAGTSYDYDFSAIDPNGDKVKFFIQWGDTTSEWTDETDSGTPITVSHTWDTEDTFTVSAYAEDTGGLRGPETKLDVTMPRNKLLPNTFFMRLLERFPNAFPILRQLLGL